METTLFNKRGRPVAYIMPRVSLDRECQVTVASHAQRPVKRGRHLGVLDPFDSSDRRRHCRLNPATNVTDHLARDTKATLYVIERVSGKKLAEFGLQPELPSLIVVVIMKPKATWPDKRVRLDDVATAK